MAERHLAATGSMRRKPFGVRRESIAWGFATVLAAALCLLAVPAMPLLWAVGRLTSAADR